MKRLTGKAKRDERKVRMEMILKKQPIVQKANLWINPFEELPMFKKFTRNGMNIEMMFRLQEDLSYSERDFIIKLLADNMKNLYEESSWGWNEKDKHQELMDDRARYILAVHEGELVGFSHFRFDIEDSFAVVYCYEVQLIKSMRRNGLGKFIMQTLEFFAFKNEMDKVMLTVFKQNGAAKNFFTKMKYEIDEISPKDEEEADYYIMSKKIKKITK